MGSSLSICLSKTIALYTYVQAVRKTQNPLLSGIHLTEDEKCHYTTYTETFVVFWAVSLLTQRLD